MKSVKSFLLFFSLAINIYLLCVNLTGDTLVATSTANSKTPITNNAEPATSRSSNTSLSTNKRLFPDVESRITLPLSIVEQIPALGYNRFLGPDGFSFTDDANLMLGISKSVELQVTQALTQLAEECNNIEAKWATISEVKGENTDFTATLIVDNKALADLEKAIQSCRQRLCAHLPEPKANLIIKESAALLKVNDLRIERIYQISKKEGSDLIRLSPTEKLQKIVNISLSSVKLRFTKNGILQSINTSPRWRWVSNFLKL